jgi:hypothetical protein
MFALVAAHQRERHNDAGYHGFVEGVVRPDIPRVARAGRRIVWLSLERKLRR